MSKKWNIYGKPTTKQRKRPDAIMFDEESRREFLTGFHSRKVKRQKLAQQEIQKQSKEARKQQKAEKRKKILEYVEEIEQAQKSADLIDKNAFFNLGSDEANSDEANADNGVKQEAHDNVETYDAGAQTITTIVSDIGDDEIASKPSIKREKAELNETQDQKANGTDASQKDGAADTGPRVIKAKSYIFKQSNNKKRANPSLTQNQPKRRKI